MGTPTRFPYGVTNVTKEDPLGLLGAPYPFKYHVYANDFDVYTAADWTVTATGTSPVALSDADGGVLTITTGGTENDGDFLEAQGESWTVESGKKLWMIARVKMSDATQSDFVFGLHSTSTTPQAAANRFLFEKVDGSAAVYFNSDDNTNDEDSDTVATAVDATWLELAAYWDGKGTVTLYADGAKVTKFTPTTVPTTELALGFGFLTGATAAITLDVDYIMVAKER